MLARLKFEEGWSTVILLLGMILTSAFGVMQAEFFDGLGVLPFVSMTAVFFGLLLSKSRFSPRTAHLFALMYGAFFTLYGVGMVLPGDLVWRERVLRVVEIQVEWLQKLIGGGTGREGYIFVLHTAVVFWLLGYTASWFTFRRPRVWFVVVPAGLVLLSVTYYYAGPEPLPLYLAFYMLLSLLFVARTHLIEQEKQWREVAVRYERNIWRNFLRAGFVGAMVALMFAWLIPAMPASAAVGDALSETRGPWREFQNNWTRLYSALRTYGSTTIDPYQNTLVLGGPRTVGDTPVLDIIVNRELPYVYWQTIVYDTYDNERWQVTQTDPFLHISDDGVLSVPFTLQRQVITQTVVNYLPNSSLMYGAPEIIGSDRDMFVEAAADDRGNVLVKGMRSRFVLKQGDRYEMISSYSTADAVSLRMAGQEYPAWVTDTYLQLPDTITEETLDLAAELTAPYDNPFDQAIAIRDYLRETIEYNDQIQAPPQGVDPVHHTLFISQEGYCTYYASAMAVMLRSQGVPTRLVSGYAQGEYNEEDTFYRVRASNAHTWVEVYFPNYGWIQFEPTASIPTVDRPEAFDESAGGDAFSSFNAVRNQLDRQDLLGEEDLTNGETDLESLEDLLDDAAAAQAQASFWETVPVWRIVTAVLILGVAMAMVAIANELNRRVESDVDRSYDRLGGWGRWLGLQIRPVHTPHERADLLQTAVPEGEQPIHNLTHQFVLKQFSRDCKYEEGFDPAGEWRVLRPLMLRRSIETWIDNLRQRRRKDGRWERP